MLTEDQKKPGISKAPGPLPGLGGKPGGGLPGMPGGGLPGAGGPLPGLGGKPSGGLPGMKPAGGGLPGMPSGGGLPGAGGPLPGLGGKPGGGLPGQPTSIAPPFMQPAQPESSPQQPAIQQDDRDPFGQASAPAGAQQSVPMMMPAVTNEVSIEDAPLMNEKSKKTLLFAVAIVSVLGIGMGFLLGNGVSGRRELNIAIRDALIVEYELKEAGKLFNDTQTMVSSALNKARKKEFDDQHLAFLKSRVAGNPLKPSILTERNYKKFDAAAVQWLIDYYKKWDRLYGLIQEHRRKTEYDMKNLKASKAEFTKLLQTNYGVVFKRKDGRFFANVVVLGAAEGSEIQVQTSPGTYGSARTLYNPEGEDSALTKEPDKFVVSLGDDSKAGLLSNATQAHFTQYSKRLKEISDLMKTMTEIQQNLLSKISSICSQAPAAFVDPDPEEGLEDYIKRSQSAGAAEEAAQ